MFSSLKNHPFPVEAFFESSLVFTFAFPKDEIKHLIPPCLQLDTHNDAWAFIAVAMVQTKDLRPKGFPKVFGSDFFLVGYRVFVRYRTNAGKNLRGLYILRSETDKRRMEFLGNVFTHYKYYTTDIHTTDQDGLVSVQSHNSGMKVSVEGGENIPLPADSPFEEWKEARRFTGPLPFTFSYDAEANKVTTVEGVRENWTPVPVKVIDYSFPFVDALNLSHGRLANACIIRGVPYSWKKGTTEILAL